MGFNKPTTSPPSPPPYKVGGIVVETIDGPKDACNGNVNTCWNFHNDVPCERNFSGCQGTKTICGLLIDGGYYPGYEDGNGSKFKCEKH